MIEPTRGARQRRVNRRPGWVLLTALLVLAIVASSALVFTNKVELLKLAVIIALWAAVVAAFISFIYRRQADIDQAKVRDLKLVYDLQLDREISARREYELSVESQLRRELSSELRSQNADEVASLRAELAALRASLEIIFDTDLQHRPALETERTAVHTFGRVISSRIDAEDREDVEANTDESPIIDVHEEPHPPEHEWTPSYLAGGAHRRPSEPEPADTGWRPPAEPAPPPPRASQASPPPAPTPPPPPPAPTPAPPPPPPPAPEPPPPPPWQEPDRLGRHAPAASNWQPAPADGQFIPAGEPGSNWESLVAENGNSSAHPPAMTPPPAEPRRGRHGTSEPIGEEAPPRARHWSQGDDPGRRSPTLASPSHPPTPPPAEPEPPSVPLAPPEPPNPRHRGADDASDEAGQHAGGQPLSELLARLQVGSTGGGRRRRREE
ncbi:MAG: hypothetical protein QOK18_1852 [Mycobacterium sp.]|nr:hypothetical protein [Mycobacterium sp.]